MYMSHSREGSLANDSHKKYCAEPTLIKTMMRSLTTTLQCNYNLQTNSQTLIIQIQFTKFNTFKQVFQTSQEYNYLMKLEIQYQIDYKIITTIMGFLN